MLMKLFAMMVLTALGLGLAGCRSNQANLDSSVLKQAWADCTLSFHARVKDEAASGLPDEPLFSAKTLPEFERKCDAVVAAAAGRDDIIKSVELLRDAVRYESKVDFLPFASLRPPDNEDLAHLLQGSDGKISPGRARGACLVAWSRLVAFYGAADRQDELYMEFSEKRYQMLASPLPSQLEDPPSGSEASPGEAAIVIADDGSVYVDGKLAEGAQASLPGKLPPEEMEVFVRGDGSALIDGKEVAAKDLHGAFVVRVERSRRTDTALSTTIRAGTEVEFQHISRILAIMDGAGVRGISFQADEAMVPPPPSPPSPVKVSPPSDR